MSGKNCWDLAAKLFNRGAHIFVTFTSKSVLQVNNVVYVLTIASFVIRLDICENNLDLEQEFYKTVLEKRFSEIENPNASSLQV